MSITSRQYNNYLDSAVDTLIRISHSWFYHGKSGMEIVRSVEVDATCITQILDSTFFNNTAYHLFVQEERNAGADEISVFMSGCIFSESLVGIFVTQFQRTSYRQNILKVTVYNSTISNNYYMGISIHNANKATISNSKIFNNAETGLEIFKTFAMFLTN